MFTRSVFGSITDQEKGVSFFLDEMCLTAAQLAHLSLPKKGHVFFLDL